MADNKVVLEFELQGNATEKTQSLRAQMRQLREELARLPEGTAEYNKVQRQLGELTDKVGDLSRSVNTLSGDPLERLNNSFGMIGSSILSLDFGAAQTGLQGVTSAIKDFKFGDLTKAAKGFGTTMMDLGKALLTNPIFLIGSIIALIIVNFEKLTQAGGLVGKMFSLIKERIDTVINGLTAFMDWIGLTDSKAAEREEAEKKRAEEAKKRKDEELKKAKEVEKEKERLAKEAADKEAQRIQKIKDDQKSLTEFLKAENEKRYQDTLADDDRLIRQLRLQYEERKKQAHGNAELLKQLDQWYAAESNKIHDEHTLVVKGKDLTRVTSTTQANDKILETTKGYLASLGVAYQDSANTNVEIEKMSTEARLQMASSALGSLIALNDAFPANSKKNALKSFKINKALQLAQASISGTQSVMAVLADPTLVGPARFIAAATAGVAAAANIAKIQKTTFDSSKFDATTPSGGGGGTMGGGGSTAAPALDLSFLNNGQTKSQPLQTYVLATNVTSAQDAQQKIIDQSKLIK